MVKIINSSQEFNQIAIDNEVVILLLSTKPCPMCEKVETLFEDISNTFNKDYAYCKVIVPWFGASEDIKRIPKHLGFRYAPALCVIKNGKLINYLIEFISKTQIIDFIQNTLNSTNS